MTHKGLIEIKTNLLRKIRPAWSRTVVPPEKGSSVYPHLNWKGRLPVVS